MTLIEAIAKNTDLIETLYQVGLLRGKYLEHLEMYNTYVAFMYKNGMKNGEAVRLTAKELCTTKQRVYRAIQLFERDLDPIPK